MVKTRKSGIILLVLMLCLPLVFSNLPTAFAEGPSDPAPVIQPIGSANGKKILFDNTHGQTAGAADWVIDGGFSDFANGIAGNGYYVKELRKTTPITYSDLQGYDVLVIGEANIPYKTSEQDALLQYAQNGGSIFFIADHYNADRNKNRWDASEVFNGYRRGAWDNPAKGMTTEEANSAAMQGVASSDWLSTNFGVRFRYNALADITANDIVAPSQAFGITSGVSTVAMHAGSTLAITDGTKAKGIVYLPQTTASWSHAVDQGVYDGGGRAEGPFVAVSKVGLGKAAFIGDSSPVEDATPKYKREETGQAKTTYDGFKEQNDGVLLENIIDWLSQHENYTSLSQVSGLQLDQPTALLSMETPQSSTEPQAETWAAPDAGYKWYDPSTFKAGSYGNTGTGGSGGGTGGSGSSTENVYISEYVEGSSLNKAIEIYNGTSSAIDLSGYSLQLSNVSGAISLSGTLASGDVFVVANSGASQTVLNKADLLSSSLSFNGDDSVTLQHNGAVVDVVGTAGTSFGTDKTLVRNSSVTTGTTAYDSSEWTSYPADTFSYLGSHTGTVASGTAVLNENFETGSKGSYTAGNVTLASGSWYFDNALLGNLSSDVKNGSQSARVKASGALTMNFDVNGAKSVVISHANFGSDTGATWQLQMSTNQGGSWTNVGSLNTSSSTLTKKTFSVNQSSSVRFRIVVSGTSGNRLNFDDIQILN
ncbi:lamin tail-like protein [Falsibacillus pallidus]|uniref:Lamin tail-like protein n=1 Tax=Falsibacillus pallidus TaxID=493781 RepID=A0A370GB08_9BACI|nr:lamin tail-like protein [Falsibacillus pallidus]